MASPTKPASEFGLNERDLHTVLYDPFSDDFRSDPYPVYHRLRKEHPMYWHPAGFWIATRYADCNTILRDRRFLTVDPRAWQGDLVVQAAPEDTKVLQTELRRTMLFAAPEDHQRYRGPLNRAFAPRVVEQRRHRARAVANRLIDRFPRGRPFDFMALFASPFPILFIADLFGVPPEDQQRVADWSRTISPILDPASRPDAISQASRTIREFHEYMDRMLRDREEHPTDDLLSLMQQPSEDGSVLSRAELVANVGFVLAAGHGTATHLMGNGLWTLLRHPPVWEELQRTPGVPLATIQEILRYESPAQMTMREPTESIPVGGRLIQKGRRVLVMLGAANRDPAAFPEPDRFDPKRTPNDHLAFSGGSHYCLGAAIAAIEGQEAFGALLQRVPGLRLVENGWEWQRTITMRGFRSLQVVA